MKLVLELVQFIFTFMSANHFILHIYVSIPQFSKVVDIDVEPSDTIQTVIDKILALHNIQDHTNWTLFTFGHDFIALDPTEQCKLLLFSKIETLILQQISNFKQISVFCNGEMTKIPYCNSQPISSVMPILLRIFDLPQEDFIYFFMNPFNYTIEPIDSPTNSETIILKPFSLNELELIFSSNCQFPPSPTIPSLPFVSSSKILFNPQFKSFMTTLKNQHGVINIVELEQSILEKLLTSFDSNPEIGNISTDQQVTLLFTILTSLPLPLLPENLAKLATDIVQKDDQVEMFYLIYCLICMLSVSSHCILLELCQSISIYFPSSPSQELIVQIFHQLLFKHEFSDPNEIKFARFVAIFGNALMHLPGIKNIYVYENKIGVFNNNEKTMFLLDGSVIPAENATQLAFSISQEHFEKLLQQTDDSIDIESAVESANAKLLELKEIIDKSKLMIKKYSCE